jgi:hypothetical protein
MKKQLKPSFYRAAAPDPAAKGSGQQPNQQATTQDAAHSEKLQLTIAQLQDLREHATPTTG